jgi:GT2 family glycosyltransferase
MKKLNSITCIIPTYNGVHLLQKYLPSVFAALETGDEVIICDDASTDLTAQWLTQEFSLEKQESTILKSSATVLFGLTKNHSKQISIKLVINHTNMRFGKTVNAGVELCHNPYFFLVNNDVRLEPDAIKVLRHQVLEDDNIFAIGCLEYEDNKTGQKSGKNTLWFEKGLYQHARASNFESGETAWASGGSALFSADKWKKLGGFDPAFFPAYWEDIDISLRARKNGWKVLFNKDAVVYHKHESTNAATFGTKKLTDISWNHAKIFTWKHSNIFQKIQYLVWSFYWYIQRVRHSN